MTGDLPRGVATQNAMKLRCYRLTRLTKSSAQSSAGAWGVTGHPFEVVNIHRYRRAVKLPDRDDINRFWFLTAQLDHRVDVPAAEKFLRDHNLARAKFDTRRSALEALWVALHAEGRVR